MKENYTYKYNLFLFGIITGLILATILVLILEVL